MPWTSWQPNRYLCAMHIYMIHVPITLMVVLIVSALVSFVAWFLSRNGDKG